jgi:hypothetical protein
MSSPRRTAKDALERAAQAARGSRPEVPTEKASVKIATADCKRVTDAIERSIADGKLDTLPPEALQALIAAACRLYAARREAGEQFLPVAKNALPATDVMVTASGLLRTADLAAFELGMWQGWTGR